VPGLRSLKFRFPWRAGNRFRLLVDGRQFVPRIIGAIDAARDEVLIEMYLFESGAVATRVLDALCAAAARGVRVHVLLDDFGALGLEAEDRRRLYAAGAKLAYYNPLHTTKLLRNFFRDHRKLVVADGAVAFTGGAGITDEFDPPDRPYDAWRETMIEIRGPVVRDWQALFSDTWSRCDGAPLAPPEAEAAPAGASRGRVAAVQGPLNQEIQRSLLRRVHNARTRVWIATAYFLPSWKVRRALLAAVRRGADVRLLLPGPITDHPAVRHAGRRFYHRLLRHGVRIFEFQPRFLHQKVALCDDWVSIGSANLDRWNLRWNLEANQEVDDSAFARAVHAMLVADFRDATECLYEAWKQRPWYRRAPEWLWMLVDRALERLGRR